MANENLTNINWYPGHMTKAKRMMQEDIKLIDLVIELLDARVPLASRNPDINTIAGNKSRLIILNKTDLADPEVTKKWAEYFEKEGCFVLKINSKNPADIRPVNDIVKKACAEKIERYRKRGIKNRPVRAMVAGIPNVGKSTFINSYAKKAATKTGNKPGVTKGKQWIRLSSEIELLDTPGILWPKFEDRSVGLKLAMIGSIRDEILNTEDLAIELIKTLEERYPGLIERFYNLEDNFAKSNKCEKKEQNMSAEVNCDNDILDASINENVSDNNIIDKKSELNNADKETVNNKTVNNCENQGNNMILVNEKNKYAEILYEIARVRGCLLRGGEFDTLKASQLLLENFRNGKLGRISLETPEN